MRAVTEPTERSKTSARIRMLQFNFPPAFPKKKTIHRRARRLQLPSRACCFLTRSIIVGNLVAGSSSSYVSRSAARSAMRVRAFPGSIEFSDICRVPSTALKIVLCDQGAGVFWIIAHDILTFFGVPTMTSNCGDDARIGSGDVCFTPGSISRSSANSDLACPPRCCLSSLASDRLFGRRQPSPPSARFAASVATQTSVNGCATICCIGCVFPFDRPHREQLNGWRCRCDRRGDRPAIQAAQPWRCGASHHGLGVVCD